MENELEELRKQLEQEKTLKEMYFTYYKAKHSDIKGKLFRYKQTLAEIKEIAEIKQKQSVFVGETVFEQILQLISECEVENDKQD